MVGFRILRSMSPKYVPGCGVGDAQFRGMDTQEARHHSSRCRASNCPSWARTRTLLIPCHFGFRRRSHSERSWSGLCLHLRRYAVRWLPPSLYTFPSRGLARRCQSRVRRLREHSRAPFPAWRPASAPRGAARVRRVASYTKGQRSFSSRLASSQDEDHFTRNRGPGQLRLTPGHKRHESNPVCSQTSDGACVPRVRVVRSQESEHSGLGYRCNRREPSRERS